MLDNKKIKWDSIISRIDKQRFTPIISNGVMNDTLFGNDNLVQAWSTHISYPLTDCDNLTRAAQFLSITERDPVQAKNDYLLFLNRQLLKFVRAKSGDKPAFLDKAKLKRDVKTLSLSQLATNRLNYPDFKEEQDNPLNILASLDLPIYLTTSHHHFMEAALTAMSKTPRTEVYCWRDDLKDNLPPEYLIDQDFEPTVENPLVYHLHGIDDYPDSLVLTEDDHLEFLVNVTRHFKKADFIPSTIRNALSSSQLLLLGYELHAWDLRVLLQGLIKDLPRRSRSFAIQLPHTDIEGVNDPQEFQNYLHQYFDQAKFDIYWGTPQSFMQTLWEKWEEF